MAKRSTPTFSSVTQPIQLAGGERGPVVLTIGFGAMLGVTAWFTWNPIPAVGCLFTLGYGLYFWRSLAKRDPLMVQVAMRYWSYRRFYPAKSPVRPKASLFRKILRLSRIR